MFVHPFMPDLSAKSLEDITKEMNDIYVKLRNVRNPGMIGQMQMVLQGYRDEYAKRMNQEMERKPKTKTKTTTEEKDG
jgi:hypothetical protein